MDIWVIFKEISVDGFYCELDMLEELHTKEYAAIARCNWLNKHYPFNVYKTKKLKAVS